MQVHLSHFTLILRRWLSLEAWQLAQRYVTPSAFHAPQLLSFCSRTPSGAHSRVTPASHYTSFSARPSLHILLTHPSHSPHTSSLLTHLRRLCTWLLIALRRLHWNWEVSDNMSQAHHGRYILSIPFCLL